ncbi:hypothetical protein C8J57DRAFT_1246093 [Mycena rebaudengoi]|nr:hypothetical protein C8J57DRAFT_1246093 [Mycena rebaudengoi]
MRQIVHFCLVNLEPIERTEEALPSAYIPTGTNERCDCAILDTECIFWLLSGVTNEGCPYPARNGGTRGGDEFGAVFCPYWVALFDKTDNQGEGGIQEHADGGWCTSIRAPYGKNRKRDKIIRSTYARFGGVIWKCEKSRIIGMRGRKVQSQRLVTPRRSKYEQQARSLQQGILLDNYCEHVDEHALWGVYSDGTDVHTGLRGCDMYQTNETSSRRGADSTKESRAQTFEGARTTPIETLKEDEHGCMLWHDGQGLEAGREDLQMRESWHWREGIGWGRKNTHCAQVGVTSSPWPGGQSALGTRIDIPKNYVAVCAGGGWMGKGRTGGMGCLMCGRSFLHGGEKGLQISGVNRMSLREKKWTKGGDGDGRQRQSTLANLRSMEETGLPGGWMDERRKEKADEGNCQTFFRLFLAL